MNTPGISFPQVAGARSTTPTAIAILADAVRGTDPALADRMAANSSWRKDYIDFFAAMTALSADAEAAITIARAGLESMRGRLLVATDAGDVPLEEAKLDTAPSHTSETIVGSASPAEVLAIPYRGRILSGDELREQLHRWRDAAIVEPGFVTAIEYAIEHPEVLRIEGRQVILLGAGAEMGPLEALAAWGADVVACDVPVDRVWERIRSIASAGAGRVTAPVDTGASVPGVDLSASPTALAAWLQSVSSPGKAPLLATHAYADGGQHVLLSAAADLIATTLLADHDDTALAYMGTPTDSYLVPSSIMDDSRARWASRPAGLRLAQGLTRAVSMGNLFRPAYAAAHDTREWGVADIMLPMQGPNYALAKRLQRWRGVIAAHDGHTASLNVAPASWTRSVTKNRVFNIAYSGASSFGAEIFPADTSRWLMAAKLAVDVATPSLVDRSHPEALLYADANHGGFWRVAYEPKSALGMAAVAGLPSVIGIGGRGPSA
ncbi:hypothetical protein [Nocardioides sp. Kera G14]|uniref:hypothetical protein n=1 Tax=Nocardioides sp. Kera G14 TaxID=2884264 RepID=UPI001D0F8362|nr:hypothetical protein [Nocardioides sp. Kera G14]UDY23542.1 hypothetical protein LH076_15980 [Nocardioides sp. Kera G14]